MTGKQIIHALNMTEVVKQEADVPIVWGGVHASLMPKQTLDSEYADYVIVKEGEKTFYELLDFLKARPKGKGLKGIKGLAYLKGKQYVQTEQRPFMDMNQAKDTPWHLVNVEDYIHSNVVVKGSKRELDIGETSRGCPFRCGFCYNSVFHNSMWRPMSVEKSVEKIEWHVKKFKLDVVWLRDDEYFANLKRTVDISKRLIEDGLDVKWYTSGIRVDLFQRLSDDDIRILIESGCEGFRFGIESGNNRVLRLIGKNITRKEIFDANERCKRLDVTPHYSFMAGFPTETLKEVYDTLEMMEKLKRDNPKAKIHVINLFTPYPGGELFNILIKDGLKTPDRLEGWSKFHHLQDYAINLTKDERAVLRNIADVSYFTSEAMLDALPGKMRVFFKPIESWLNMRKKMKSFRIMPEVQLLRRLRDMFMESR
jgi:radical SAM superfamily enzyme YgiQ (UPF0313 family)